MTIHQILVRQPELAYDPADYLKNLSTDIFNVEVAIGSILDAKPDPRGIISVVQSELAGEHLQKVRLAWKTIRPFLEIHKRGGRLAD
jgi:hypothetical protein